MNLSLSANIFLSNLAAGYTRSTVLCLILGVKILGKKPQVHFIIT